MSEQTMEKVLHELSLYGFPPPTNSTKTGLHDLAEAMAKMAEGRLPPQYHLASLDPGRGKTTMVKHFLDCLLRSPHHEGVSVIVFVSRHDEIEKLVHALKEMDHGDHVGVLVGEKDADRFNKLGDVPHTEARVLITTQQMLERRSRGRCFAKSEVFQYQGSPRPVRIWDEAFMPGEEYALSSDDLASLIRPARDRCNELAMAIEELKDELKSATRNKRFSVPSLHELGGRSASAALHRIASDKTQGEYVRKAAQALMDMAGQAPKVFTNSNGIGTMLDYRDTIPSDLAPMVILDASGRCRHTYRLMEKHRENLVRLQEVTKDYSQLEIGVWPIGGGRSSFADDAEGLRLRGIAETIQRRPGKPWLVIHHMDREGGPRFKDQLSESLPPETMEQVSFLHWGDHHGTNAFADIENVILAGTLFLPSMIYEGRARLAAQMCDEDKVPLEVLRAVRNGEHAHGILQGLCRAAVRGLDAQGRCKPCRAYIIASPNSGIRRLLSDLFLGCRIQPWRPFPEKVKGKVKEAIDLVDEIVGHDPDLVDFISFKELRDKLGVKDASNFRRLVLRKPSFWEAVRERGLEETKSIEDGRTLKGLSFTQNPFLPDPDAEDIAT